MNKINFRLLSFTAFLESDVGLLSCDYRTHGQRWISARSRSLGYTAVSHPRRSTQVYTGG